MNSGFRAVLVLISLFVGLFILTSNTYAAKPIARISSFQGEAIVQSGTKIIKVTQTGLPLNQGDRIQTKQGEIQVIFNDGAVMKVRPFTNAMIQERQEKQGWWLFKTKKAVRRITCFVGKLWFKSGVSKRRNYLQTPTAVCGLRGSDGDIGFDNINTYLNMYAGQAEVIGKVMGGFFTNPGTDAATRSRVYQSLEKAHGIAKQAKATGRAVHIHKARVEALKVIKEAATAIAENNPDATLAKEAQVAANVAAANIAAEQAQVAVAQLQEAGADQSVIDAAQSAAENAQAHADLAEQAAETIYEDGVLNPDRLDQAIIDTETAATNAQEAAQAAVDVVDEAASTTPEPSAEETPTSTEEATTTTTTTTTTTFVTTTTTTPTFPTTTTTAEVSDSQ